MAWSRRRRWQGGLPGRSGDRRAKRRAGTGERSLLEVAFEAGFSSKASFNRCFKLYAGETPSAFAARLKS